MSVATNAANVHVPMSSPPSLLPLPSLSSRLLLALSSSFRAAKREGGRAAVPDVGRPVAFVLSCRRANSSILTRRSKSTLRFSADLRCPSSSAMRACAHQRQSGLVATTYPHLGALNLPLVAIAFPPPPLALEVV